MHSSRSLERVSRFHRNAWSQTELDTIKKQWLSEHVENDAKEDTGIAGIASQGREESRGMSCDGRNPLPYHVLPFSSANFLTDLFETFRSQEEVPVSNTPVRDSMQAKLERELSPVRLSIEDNSDQHSGHAGSKGLRSTETHLAIEIVSEKFSGMNQLKRHRLVYGIVDEEMKAGVHALSITAKTPDEVGM